jgi:hypothetical protein
MGHAPKYASELRGSCFTDLQVTDWTLLNGRPMRRESIHLTLSRVLGRGKLERPVKRSRSDASGWMALRCERRCKAVSAVGADGGAKEQSYRLDSAVALDVAIEEGSFGRKRRDTEVPMIRSIDANFHGLK